MSDMTRGQVVDRLARIIRDSLDPSFRAAPPPAWAESAAAEIIAYHQPMLRDTLLDAARAEAAADALRAARARVAALVSPGMVKSQLEGNPNACGYVEAINRVLAALGEPADD